MIGQSVGPYRILSKLGAGGMGEVYLAEDVRLGRKVALKSPSRSWLRDPDARIRLQREARAAARLNNPRIAAVYDVLDLDRPYIVMEYVDGETLATRLHRERLSVEQALALGVELADALAVAHAAGVVHRDLKPGNIVLTESGHLKVLDFGLAKTMPLARDEESTHLTHPGQVLGTPGYVAPEQLLGRPADARSDIYSAGAILYEMMTGRAPFEQRDSMGRALASLVQPVRPVAELAPGVPPEVGEAIVKAMAREPDDRFASAAELRDVLARAMADLRNSPTRLLGVPVRAGNAWVRRWSPAVAAVLAVALVIALGPPLARRWSGTRGGGANGEAGALPVVAVLPVASATGDAEVELLASGLSELLGRTITSLRGVRVVPRAETMEYKERKTPLTEIGRALSATYVIDAGLKRQGSELYLDVQLFATGTGAVPWRDQFAGRAADLIIVGDQVAGGVRRALGLEGSTGTGGPATGSVDAFRHYSEGRAFLDRRDIPGNVDRAIELFQSAIEKDARFALAHAALGEAYWEQYLRTRDAKWTERARDAMLVALSLEPDQPQVAYTLALIWDGTGRSDLAIEQLRKANATSETDSAHRLLGEIFVDRGEGDAAVREFERAIALRPQFWANHAALGVACFRLGKYDQAEAAFRRVTELQPDNPWGFQQLGATYQARGDFATAMQHYERSIGLGPLASTYSNIGTVHFAERRYEQAVAAYRRACELSRRDPRLRRNLGDALMKVGRPREARAAYVEAIALVQDALKVNPKSASNLALLAVCEAKVQRFAEARQHAANAVELAPSDPEILYRRAIVHALAGDPDAALSSLRLAVSHGYSPRLAREDDDLASLRVDPRFERALAAAR